MRVASNTEERGLIMFYVFFAAFSVLSGLIFNYVNPYVQGSSWAQKPGAQSYIGKALVTGAAFFVVLTVASFVMGAVLKKPELPS